MRKSDVKINKLFLLVRLATGTGMGLRKMIT